MAADEKFVVSGDFSGFIREAQKAESAFDKLIVKIRQANKLNVNFNTTGGGSTATGGRSFVPSINTSGVQGSLGSLTKSFNNLNSTVRQLNAVLKNFKPTGSGGSGGSGGPGGGRIPVGGGSSRNGGFSLTGHWGSDLAYSLMPGKSMFPAMAIGNGLRGAGMGGLGATAGGIAGGLGLTALLGGVVGAGILGGENVGLSNSLKSYGANYKTDVHDLKGMSSVSGLDAKDFAGRQVQFQNATGLGSDKAGQMVNWASDIAARSGGAVSVDEAQKALAEAVKGNTQALGRVSEAIGINVEGKTLEQTFSEHSKAGVIGSADQRSNIGKVWDNISAGVGETVGHFMGKADAAIGKWTGVDGNDPELARKTREVLLDQRKNNAINSEQFHSMLGKVSEAEKTGDFKPLKNYLDSSGAGVANPFSGRHEQVQSKQQSSPAPTMPVRNEMLIKVQTDKATGKPNVMRRM